MQIRQLDTKTYVGPQISVVHLAEIAGLGVRTIIVARPEGEDTGQPEIAEISKAADALGIRVQQIPVIPGEITDDDVRAFEATVTKTPRPVFAYCRSGIRAAALWALSTTARTQ